MINPTKLSIHSGVTITSPTNATPTSSVNNNEEDDLNNNEEVIYNDVDHIEGTFNDNGDPDEIGVTWQKGGLIRCEVKVFMDTGLLI